MKQENHVQKDWTEFWHRNLDLKIGCLQFLKSLKELKEVGTYRKYIWPKLLDKLPHFGIWVGGRLLIGQGRLAEHSLQLKSTIPCHLGISILVV